MNGVAVAIGLGVLSVGMTSAETSPRESTTVRNVARQSPSQSSTLDQIDDTVIWLTLDVLWNIVNRP